MKSKLILLGLLGVSFDASALKPNVNVDLFGAISHSGIKFKNKFAREEVQASENLEDSQNSASEKGTKESKGDNHNKVGFAMGAAVGCSFKKDNLSFGLEGGLIFNMAKYGAKDFSDIRFEANETDLRAKFVEAEIPAVHHDFWIEELKSNAEKTLNGFKRLESKVPGIHATAEKFSKEHAKKSSLVTNNGMLFFVGPTAGMQFTEKMSAKLAFDCVFSGVTIEPKDIEVEKFEKTFFGFGPKVSFNYDITSSISAFAFAGYFFFVDKKYKEDTKATAVAKESLAVSGENGIQHSNMFLGGLGVSFKLNG